MSNYTFYNTLKIDLLESNDHTEPTSPSVFAQKYYFLPLYIWYYYMTLIQIKYNIPNLRNSLFIGTFYYEKCIMQNELFSMPWTVWVSINIFPEQTFFSAWKLKLFTIRKFTQTTPVQNSTSKTFLFIIGTFLVTLSKRSLMRLAIALPIYISENINKMTIRWQLTDGQWTSVWLFIHYQYSQVIWTPSKMDDHIFYPTSF